MRGILLLLCACVVGCGSSGTTIITLKSKDADHDHDHDRGKMMLADAGPYHAGLTSHLSAKDGNELDLFFETAGNEPKPVALPLDKITATIRREGDEKTYDVTFEPAPADERPKGEAAGTCSHFVAKVPFVKPTDVLNVSLTVVIREKPRSVAWKNFDVKKYCHHQDGYGP